jgi:NAD(P)-dependent dehydrogenase (short-subunit alcohol dehydrogenase family)
MQQNADFLREAGAIPLGRAIRPEEIAAAVLFLVEARSVTGQMIAVDGGQHLAWKTPDVEI